VVAISIGGEDDLETEPEVSFLTAILFGWLGVGRVPFLLLVAADLCLWGLLGWSANILSGVPGSPVAEVIFIVSGLVGMLLGGAIARPAGQIFFAPFSEDASSDRLVGCLGTVSSVTIPRLSLGKVGQVDVVDPAKNLVTVNAVIPNDAQIEPSRGDQVIVIEHFDAFYVVIDANSVDRDRWLGMIRDY